MTEYYIHFLWKLKRLPFHLFKTTDNQNIFVVNNGIYNTSESGPDFTNARIIIDKIEWVGQIEIHVKSSDWYKHNHHLDPAYDNVILHVVYEDDCQVLINGEQVPTVAIKPYIDKEHFSKWENLAKNKKDIPCSDLLHSIDSIYLKMMIHKVIFERMNRKLENQNKHFIDDQSFLYHLIAKAFGSKVNELPFELLTNQVPYSLLRTIKKSIQKKILINTSGLYNHVKSQSLQENNQINQLPASIWKRKGLRPTSFPEKRIIQFANLITRINLEYISKSNSPIEVYQYLQKNVEEVNVESDMPITKQFVNQMLINAFLPFFWSKAIKQDNEQLKEEVLKLMETIPIEDNYIVKKWNTIGVKPNNAYETQALIEIYNCYCVQKKCLNCQIGTKILNQKNDK